MNAHEKGIGPSEHELVELIFDIHNCSDVMSTVASNDGDLAERIRAVIEFWKDDET